MVAWIGLQIIYYICLASAAIGIMYRHNTTSNHKDCRRIFIAMLLLGMAVILIQEIALQFDVGCRGAGRECTNTRECTNIA